MVLKFKANSRLANSRLVAERYLRLTKIRAPSLPDFFCILPAGTSKDLAGFEGGRFAVQPNDESALGH
jgi:hypothetical protein